MGCHGYTATLLRAWITGFDQGRIKLRIPKTRGLMKVIPEMPFHLEPELFFQISGVTTFEFPEEELQLYPNEICLVPVGMPHRERICAYKKEPFLNLMFGYNSDFIHFHLAHEAQKGLPGGFLRSHLRGVDHDHLLGHLSDLIERFNREDAGRSLAIKSVLLDHLFTLLYGLGRVESISEAHKAEAHKTLQIGGILRQYLTHRDLSVEWIARKLNISPDYASRIFKKSTGRTLIAHITEQRLLLAKHLLKTSSLNISEISRAIGYENSNYFTQLFRKFNGMPPREYWARFCASSDQVPPTGPERMEKAS